jgi:hypothetical protein
MVAGVAVIEAGVIGTVGLAVNVAGVGVIVTEAAVFVAGCSHHW